jgi:glutamyl-tRNA synthetase
LEPKAAALLTPEARAMLARLTAILEATPFTAPDIDAALRTFADAEGLKLGAVAQPLRAALTGSTMSPGIDATLVALGKDEALQRLRLVKYGK